MPTTVCVKAQDGRPVWQWQLSAPWTALTQKGAILLRSLLQNGWCHDPRDFILAYRAIVVPVGIDVYSILSIIVFSFWFDKLIIVVATAVLRFVCFRAVNVLWFVCFEKWVLGFSFFTCALWWGQIICMSATVWWPYVRHSHWKDNLESFL